MYYVTMNFRLGEATFFSRFDSRVVLHIFSPVILIMFMWWWFFEKKNKFALAVFVFLRDLIDFSVEMQDWFFNLFCFIFPYFSLSVIGILRLAHLVLQNVNKDYAIFSYFRNFFAKSDQKPKTKMGWTKQMYWICFKWEFRTSDIMAP